MGDMRERNDVPCRTFESVKISKCVNSTLFSFMIAMVCLEKPHLGVSGEPFMKTTTLLWSISLRRRFSSCSGVSSTSEGSITDPMAGLPSVCDSAFEADKACFARPSVSFLASAPSTRSSRVWPYNGK